MGRAYRFVRDGDGLGAVAGAEFGFVVDLGALAVQVRAFGFQHQAVVALEIQGHALGPIALWKSRRRVRRLRSTESKSYDDGKKTSVVAANPELEIYP